MKVSVLGCGRWASFLAWYSASRVGHDVAIWGRKGSPHLEELAATRRNEYLTLPDGVRITDSLDDALSRAEIVLIAVSAQGLRSLAAEIARRDLSGRTFALCMKGIEAETGKRLTQVFREEVRGPVDLAVWVGPGHVQEFVRGVPNCMLIGSDNIEATRRVAEALASRLIRFYYGQDLIGNEIGAAAKNVMGIAAGMLDGLDMSSLKSALMARGAREVSRLVRAMGGNELTIYGLCHLGDYEATLFSPHSHNRRFGESLIRGERFDKLAEGVPTADALSLLSKRHEVEMPISNAVRHMIREGGDPKGALEELFLRPLKFEF
ncbi:MAG TPA: NAD(P)H-dependent glycerol-3-phosphate dehydrogenase [Candidatus Brocadiia bacterium]|nr:NAD(P)H-dependent glycerol-3-phosphate dehydrogenase [Candidatus Brocadiia bacterium]